MNALTALASLLIRIPSITPYDNGCQEILITRLKALGFSVVPLPYGKTQNFWASSGEASPSFVFAGHTDVVPIGDEKTWQYPPFLPTLLDGYLYGRGAADMKGSLASMIIAVERFMEKHSTFHGSIGFLITSAEEGPAEEGTPIVLDYLREKNIPIDYCIVGEPTSHTKVGDTIKQGRRGSLSGHLTIRGKQGHVAYPHLADNPIHRAMPALSELIHFVWDNGHPHFDETCFQISNIHAGTGATNVIPGEVQIDFNLRYSPTLTALKIQETIQSLLKNIDYTIVWQHYGEPYLTVPSPFLEKCQTAILETTGYPAQLSTSGGTSDARYIAKYCPQVIELGPVNATIHQVNECVAIADLEKLAEIYLLCMEKLLITV